MTINRNAWSPDEREEYDALIEEVVASGTNTSERLDLMERLVDDAIQAQRPWARDLDRSARRHGYASEIKRYQDGRHRALVACDTGQVLNLPRVQGTVARGESGEAYHQRSLIEVWSWEQVVEKRAEAIRARRKYADKIAHYDRLLALRDLCPDSTSPADAARRLGIDLGGWLAEQEAS